MPDPTPNLNPVQFGALMQQVDTLERQVTDLQKDVKALLEMANKSRGGLWAGMMFASMFGGTVSWLATHIRLS